VQTFLRKHADKITGVLSCFDRLIFKGHLPLCFAQGLESFLDRHGILLKNFKAFAPAQADLVKEHALALAKREGRPYEYLYSHRRKDELAQHIARRDNITQGLICIFSTLELCPTFKVIPGEGRPHLQRAKRKCLCLYFYYLDAEFGLMHIRLQTWFPLTVQVYVNGHHWLARRLDLHKVGYQLRDNAFVALDNPDKAQRLADDLFRKKWHRVLKAFARRVNPLLSDLLKGMDYQWVTDQAEFATDILFKDRASLQTLYARLLDHATLQFGAEEVLTFLGKKLRSNFTGEVLTDCQKKRWPGARVKHRVAGNWIKMYDKFGCVLRVEVVINRPYTFRVLRWGTRQGKRLLAWFPLAKKVDYLRRYAEISSQAARRYLDALAVVDDPQVSQAILDRACNRVAYRKRHRRALNPLSRADQSLFFAVLCGEHHLQGFRNKDIAKHLGWVSTDAKETRRYSARVSRCLQLLRAHGLIAKNGATRTYRVSDTGMSFMSAAIHLRFRAFPAELANVA
jgi:hypothetical protein